MSFHTYSQPRQQEGAGTSAASRSLHFLQPPSEHSAKGKTGEDTDIAAVSRYYRVFWDGPSCRAWDGRER